MATLDASVGRMNERAISLKEVREAVNEMKLGKAPRLARFPVECLKKGGMVLLEWLVTLLCASSDMGVVPMNWHCACIDFGKIFLSILLIFFPIVRQFTPLFH